MSPREVDRSSAPGRRVAILALSLAAAALASGPAPAQQALQAQLGAPEIADALRAGGYVILMRHGATGDRVDTDEFGLADCTTQRNLSELGHRQSMEMSEALRALEIPIGKVLSSPYCRCLQTAELAFGESKAEVSEVLRGGLASAEQGAKVRQMLGTEPAAGTNTVIVSHTGALLYSFGLEPNPEGIVHVFRPAPVGPARYIGQVFPDRWPALAESPPPAPEAATP